MALLLLCCHAVAGRDKQIANDICAHSGCWQVVYTALLYSSELLVYFLQVGDALPCCSDLLVNDSALRRCFAVTLQLVDKST
jgi:hypothetical protein